METAPATGDGTAAAKSNDTKLDDSAASIPAVSFSLDAPAAGEVQPGLQRLKSHASGAYAGLLGKTTSGDDVAQPQNPDRANDPTAPGDGSDVHEEASEMLEVDWQQIQYSSQAAPDGASDVPCNESQQQVTNTQQGSTWHLEHEGVGSPPATGSNNATPAPVQNVVGGQISPDKATETSDTAKYIVAEVTSATTSHDKGETGGKGADEKNQQRQDDQGNQDQKSSETTNAPEQADSAIDGVDGQRQPVVPSSPLSANLSEPWEQPVTSPAPDTDVHGNSSAQVREQTMVETAWASSLSHSSQRTNTVTSL